MNKLMMMVNGGAMRYMDENGGNGGEGGGSSSNGGENKGGEGGSAPTNTAGENGGEGGENKGGEGGQGGEGNPEPKPFLGGENKGGEGGENKNTEGNPPQNEGAEKPATEEEFLKAITTDEKVLGRNDIQLNQALIKACVPTMQKYGVKPEAAKELANVFAKAQMDAVKEMYKERCAFFEKGNKAAQEKYDEKGFSQINRGIDHCFKKGGVMNNVIRNSELGCDPEFLALMHKIGGEVKEDTGAGTAAGAGEGGGDPNGIQGLAKMW